MVLELDEVIDQLYVKIHHFIKTKVGEELEQDLIDISLETNENGELILSIELYLELTPFPKHDIQMIAEEAVKHGVQLADQICPRLIVKVRS